MSLFNTLFTEETQEFLLKADIPYDDLSEHGIEFISDDYDYVDLEDRYAIYIYIIKFKNRFYSIKCKADGNWENELLTDTLTEVTPTQKTITVYEPITYNT